MRSHKEILAWQRARQNVVAVDAYFATTWHPSRAAMADQLRRASLSVMVNISEGYAHGPGAKFRAHLRIAYGSAVETTDLLELLEELQGGVGEMVSRSREVQALTLRLWQRCRRA